MPGPVSPEKVSEYLSLRMEGYDNKEASSLTGFSSRTGSNYLRSFREDAKRGGIMRAARNYGLKVDDLFKLAGQLKENGLTVDRCGVGLYIANALVSLGIDLTILMDLLRIFFLKPRSKDCQV